MEEAFLTVWMWRCRKDILTKGWLNQWISNRGFCRAALGFTQVCKTWANFISTILLHSLEKISFDVRKLFSKPVIFWKNCFYSYIYISTLLSNYTQMKMINLSPPHCICWKSLGYWLSVWPREPSVLQSPSKRLAAILCLLTKGWGKRCGK